MVSPPQLVAIWCRTIDGQPAAGRPRIIAWLRSAPLRDATHLVLHHMFSIAWAEQLLLLLRCCWQLLLLQPWPLQSCLFAPPTRMRRLMAALVGARGIYLDGVRCLALLPYLPAQARVVCDLDDLMSRRMGIYRRQRIRPSLGFLRAAAPAWLQAALRALSDAVLRYEQWALARAEARIADRCHIVALVSHAESGELARRCPAARARIVTMPPPQPLSDPVPSLRPTLRGLFIGGEDQPQNALTLRRLLRLWQRFGITRELVWVGRRTTDSPLPERVRSVGFVDDLRTVYDGSHVLLLPSEVPGGVKTKILEALAHGCPVLGNRIAFEGLPWADAYPLILPDDDALWADWIASLDQRLPELARALDIGRACLHRYHDPQRLERRWRRLFALGS